MGRVARGIWVAAGWGAVVLGLIGVLVPGLPTTVFALAASYCFARSSPRFARWLREHRWLGPSLRRFEADGGMSPRAKRGALAAMWTAVLASSGAALVAVQPDVAAVTLTLATIGTFVILFGVRTVSA